MKKLLSLVLVVMMMLSVCAVFSTSAAETVTGKIYFEVPDFWKNWKSIYCHIFEIESGETLANWQTKKEKMVDEGDGIYSYNFDIVGGLCEDVEYGIIFSADTGAQTYQLNFNSDYIGKTAYCVQDTLSGPADNTTPLSYAYWRSDDGPSADVTPTDPVTPPENLLYGDLDFDGKVTIKDATIIQKYAAGIAVNSPVGTAIPNKIYFEVPDFWKNWKSLYCHIFEIESGETLANWQTKKEKMVDEGDGIYSYNFDIVGGLCEDVEYGIIFSADTGAQTYQLKFNSDYIGKTAYCVQDTSSGPADNTTPLAYVYWRSDDGTSADVTPTDPVTPPENLLYGDLDFDGKVTIKDATIIQKYVAGIAVNSPVGTYIN